MQFEDNLWSTAVSEINQNIRSAKERLMQIYHLLCDPQTTLVYHSRANVLLPHSLTLYSWGFFGFLVFVFFFRLSVIRALNQMKQHIQKSSYQFFFPFLVMKKKWKRPPALHKAVQQRAMRSCRKEQVEWKAGNVKEEQEEEHGLQSRRNYWKFPLFSSRADVRLRGGASWWSK